MTPPDKKQLDRAVADADQEYLSAEDRAQRVADAVVRYFDKEDDTCVVEFAGGAARRKFEELCDEAKANGFKPGWVAYRFKEHFGKWPPWAWTQRLKGDK